jgi:hypothetical protein
MAAYLVLSDIHSNSTLEAVLASSKAGGSPARARRSRRLRRRAQRRHRSHSGLNPVAVIRGNHDGGLRHRRREQLQPDREVRRDVDRRDATDDNRGIARAAGRPG